jgi:uncharacterized membrane protein
MLVVFPLGLFLTATVFDIVTLMSGSSVSRMVAFYTILAGVIGGLLAAVPGFVDYLSLRAPAARTATWHMALNLVVVALFVASLLLRTRWGAQWVPAGSSLPQALSIVGSLVLIAAGWLGGHLVYVHGVGVDNADVRRDERPRRAA